MPRPLGRRAGFSWRAFWRGWGPARSSAPTASSSGAADCAPTTSAPWSRATRPRPPTCWPRRSMPRAARCSSICSTAAHRWRACCRPAASRSSGRSPAWRWARRRHTGIPRSCSRPRDPSSAEEVTDLALHREDIPRAVLDVLGRGAVIPAHPLALDSSRKLDVARQRALSRYYLDAGAGGLAVGVHTTQFPIRQAGLYEPVLRLAMATAREWTERPLVMIAGLCGRIEQARREAAVARDLGYHAGLLSLAEMQGASDEE